MSKAFKRGDVVSLNSANITMTVTGYSDEPESLVQCDWFDVHGIRHQGNFYEETLYKRTFNPPDR